MNGKLSSLQSQQENGMTISAREAQEFCEFKREKYLRQVRSDMRKCVLCAGQSKMDVERAIVEAKAMSLAAVRLSSSALAFTKKAVPAIPVFWDCMVGGDGFCHEKVKAYEAKLAAKNGAREITLRLNSAALLGGDFESVKREVKAVKRAARKATVKLQTDVVRKPTIFRLSKIAVECGVWMLSLPYHPDLRGLQDEMHGNCLIEFYGVNDSAVYKQLLAEGIVRIASEKPSKLYDEFVLGAQQAVALELCEKTEHSLRPV